MPSCRPGKAAKASSALSISQHACRERAFNDHQNRPIFKIFSHALLCVNMGTLNP